MVDFPGCLSMQQFISELHQLNPLKWTLHTDYAVSEGYSICYSVPFQVPYLFIHDENGTFTSAELHAMIGHASSGYLDIVIDRDEHPALNIKGWSLHPCRTAELMSKIQTPRYLLCWLSIYGQPFGIAPTMEDIIKT